jgi:hypothetical protein
VAVTTLGAGCSITSTATVSTTGAIGRLIRRAAFFIGARFGLALAIVRVFARAPLWALPRLAELPFRSFARLCTFDAYLRLAMMDSFWLVLSDAAMFDQSQTGRMEVVKWGLDGVS